MPPLVTRLVPGFIYERVIVHPIGGGSPKPLPAQGFADSGRRDRLPPVALLWDRAADLTGLCVREHSAVPPRGHHAVSTPLRKVRATQAQLSANTNVGAFGGELRVDGARSSGALGHRIPPATCRSGGVAEARPRQRGVVVPPPPDPSRFVMGEVLLGSWVSPVRSRLERRTGWDGGGSGALLRSNHEPLINVSRCYTRRDHAPCSRRLVTRRM